MTLFRPMTLTWWQIGLFKLGMLALGVAIGACWPLVFHRLIVELAVVALLCLAYIGWLWLRR